MEESVVYVRKWKHILLKDFEAPGNLCVVGSGDGEEGRAVSFERLKTQLFWFSYFDHRSCKTF